MTTDSGFTRGCVQETNPSGCVDNHGKAPGLPSLLTRYGTQVANAHRLRCGSAQGILDFDEWEGVNT
jgi:hypothetical protein